MNILPPNQQITTFLLVYFGLFGLVTFLLRNLNLFGKKLGEYLKPNIVFVLLAAGAVWSQYAVCLGGGRMQVCSIAQAVWIAAVAISAAVLAQKKEFNLKNAFVLATFYSLLIHGAKASTRYVLYGQFDPLYRTARYILGRFFYGSGLVFGVAWMATSSINIRKKKAFYLTNLVAAAFLTALLAQIYRQYFM